MLFNTREFCKLVGLQFFATDDGGAGGAANGQSDPGAGTPPQGDPGTNPQGQQQQAQQQPTPSPAGKTFTQEEVNALAAKEKKQGRAAILRELGIDPEDKNAIKRYSQLIKENQTKEEQLTNDLNAANTAKDEAEARASAAEMKLAAIQKGVNPKFVDDVIILAQSKVTDDKPIDKVLDEMKTTYPAFFGEDGGSGSGTGNPANPARKPAGKTSIAERLSKNKPQQTKSAFFTQT